MSQFDFSYLDNIPKANQSKSEMQADALDDFLSRPKPVAQGPGEDLSTYLAEAPFRRFGASAGRAVGDMVADRAPITNFIRQSSDVGMLMAETMGDDFFDRMGMGVVRGLGNMASSVTDIAAEPIGWFSEDTGERLNQYAAAMRGFYMNLRPGDEAPTDLVRYLESSAESLPMTGVGLVGAGLGAVVGGPAGARIGGAAGGFAGAFAGTFSMNKYEAEMMAEQVIASAKAGGWDVPDSLTDGEITRYAATMSAIEGGVEGLSNVVLLGIGSMAAKRLGKRVTKDITRQALSKYLTATGARFAVPAGAFVGSSVVEGLEEVVTEIAQNQAVERGIAPAIDPTAEREMQLMDAFFGGMVGGAVTGGGMAGIGAAAQTVQQRVERMRQTRGYHELMKHAVVQNSDTQIYDGMDNESLQVRIDMMRDVESRLDEKINQAREDRRQAEADGNIEETTAQDRKIDNYRRLQSRNSDRLEAAQTVKADRDRGVRTEMVTVRDAVDVARTKGDVVERGQGTKAVEQARDHLEKKFGVDVVVIDAPDNAGGSAQFDPATPTTVYLFQQGPKGDRAEGYITDGIHEALHILDHFAPEAAAEVRDIVGGADIIVRADNYLGEGTRQEEVRAAEVRREQAKKEYRDEPTDENREAFLQADRDLEEARDRGREEKSARGAVRAARTGETDLTRSELREGLGLVNLEGPAEAITQGGEQLQAGATRVQRAIDRVAARLGLLGREAKAAQRVADRIKNVVGGLSVAPGDTVEVKGLGAERQQRKSRSARKPLPLQSRRVSDMSADEYIESIGGTRRVDSADRPNLGRGDTYGMGQGAVRIATRTTNDGREYEIREDEDGGMYAVMETPDNPAMEAEEVVGYAIPTGEMTDLAVVEEFRGLGIGQALAEEYRSRNPMAPSGGMTEAGERTVRRAFPVIQERAGDTRSLQSRRSSVGILDGSEDLGAEKPLAGNKSRVFDLGVAFEARAERMGYRVGDPNNLTEAEEKDIAAAMAIELAYQLAQDSDAVGWYDEKTKAALAVHGERFPEILTDSDAEVVFKAILAVTSNGQDVESNSDLATLIYGIYRNEGRIPVDLWKRGTDKEGKIKYTGGYGGTRAHAIALNLERIQLEIDQRGIREFGEFLSQEYTVKELNDLGYAVDGLVDDRVKGSMVFGPKLGAFYQNLYGDFTYLTADLWFSRTYNRYLGHMIASTEKKTEKSRVGFRKAIADLPSRSKLLRGRTKKDLKSDNDLLDAFALELEKDLDRVSFKYAKLPTAKLKGNKELFTKANSLAKKLKGLLQEAPRNGKERNTMRRIMAEALAELKTDTNIDLAVADAQAVLWYHEKQIYVQEGAANARGQESDYEQAAQATTSKLATRSGVFAGRAFERGDFGGSQRRDAATEGAGPGQVDTSLQSRRAETRTPEFRRFFGNSKFVDAQGEPVLFYRGVSGDVDDATLPTTLATLSFAIDPEYAGSYSTRLTGRLGGQARVGQYYIRSENPLVIAGGQTLAEVLANPKQMDVMEPFVTMEEVVSMAGEEAGISVANEYGIEADENADASSAKEHLNEIAEKLYGQTWEDATTIGITDPESQGQRQLQEILARIGGSYEAFSEHLYRTNRSETLGMDVYVTQLADRPDFVEALRRQGYDSILLYDDGNQAFEVRPFSRNQVKSAIGNTGEFDPASSNPLESRRDVYGSRLQQAVENLDRSKPKTPEQLRAALGQAGVQREEIYWSGMDDWLKSQDPKKPIDVDRTLAYLRPTEVVTRTETQVPRRTADGDDFVPVRETELTDVETSESLPRPGGVQPTSSVRRVRPEERLRFQDYLPGGHGPVTNISLEYDTGEEFPQRLSTTSAKKTVEGEDDVSPGHQLFETQTNTLAHVRATTQGYEQQYDTLHLAEVQSDWSSSIRTKVLNRKYQVELIAGFYENEGIDRETEKTAAQILTMMELHRIRTEKEIADRRDSMREDDDDGFNALDEANYRLDVAAHQIKVNINRIVEPVAMDLYNKALVEAGSSPVSVPPLRSSNEAYALKYADAEATVSITREQLEETLVRDEPIAVAPFVYSMRKGVPVPEWQKLALKRALAFAVAEGNRYISLPNTTFVNSVDGISVEGQSYDRLPGILETILKRYSRGELAKTIEEPNAIGFADDTDPRDLDNLQEQRNRRIAEMVEAEISARLSDTVAMAQSYESLKESSHAISTTLARYFQAVTLYSAPNENRLQYILASRTNEELETAEGIHGFAETSGELTLSGNAARAHLGDKRANILRSKIYAQLTAKEREIDGLPDDFPDLYYRVEMEERGQYMFDKETAGVFLTDIHTVRDRDGNLVAEASTREEAMAEMLSVQLDSVKKYEAERERSDLPVPEALTADPGGYPDPDLMRYVDSLSHQSVTKLQDFLVIGERSDVTEETMDAVGDFLESDPDFQQNVREGLFELFHSELTDEQLGIQEQNTQVYEEGSEVTIYDIGLASEDGSIANRIQEELDTVGMPLFSRRTYRQDAEAEFMLGRERRRGAGPERRTFRAGYAYGAEEERMLRQDERLAARERHMQKMNALRDKQRARVARIKAKFDDRLQLEKVKRLIDKDKNQERVARLKAKYGRRIDAIKADQDYKSALRNQATIAVNALPKKLRGGFIGAIKNVKTDQALSRLAYRVDRQLAYASYSDTDVLAKRATRMLNKRKMSNETRKAVNSKLTAARDLLRPTGKKIRLGKPFAPGAPLAQDLITKASEAQELINGAVEAYMTERADFRSQKDARSERLLDAATQIENNVRGKRQAKRTRKDVAGAKRKESGLRRLLRWGSDIDSMSRAVDESGVLHEYVSERMRAAESDYFSTRRETLEELDRVAREAGFQDADDLLAAASDDTLGAGTTQTVEVQIDGEQLKIRLGEAMKLVALDDETQQMIVNKYDEEGNRTNGVGIKFSEAEMGRTYYPDASDIDTIAEQLTSQQLEVVRALKRFRESMRDAAFDVFFRLNGYQPRFVPGYEPRSRLATSRTQLDPTQAGVQGVAPQFADAGGFTKERVESGGSPVLIGDFVTDFLRSSDALARMQHMAEPTRDAWSLLMDDQVAQSIAEIHGEGAVERLRQMVVNGSGMNPAALGGVLGEMQGALAGAYITANPGTFIRVALGGISRMIADADVPVPALLRATTNWLSGPSFDEIAKRSGYFYSRNRESAIDRRANTQQVGLADERRRMARRHFAAALRESRGLRLAEARRQIVLAFGQLGILDAIDRMLVRIAVQAHMNDGKNLDQAVYAAEQTIRRTQNTTSPLDDASIMLAGTDAQRGVSKFLLTFSSDPLKAGARLHEAVATNDMQAVARWTASTLANATVNVVSRPSMYIVAGMIAELLGDEEDELLNEVKTARAYQSGEVTRGMITEVVSSAGMGGYLSAEILDLLMRAGAGESTYGRTGAPTALSIDALVEITSAISTMISTSNEQTRNRAIDKAITKLLQVGIGDPTEPVRKLLEGVRDRDLGQAEAAKRILKQIIGDDPELQQQYGDLMERIEAALDAKDPD